MTVLPLRPSLPAIMIEDQVRAALLEDLGRAGDITTYATIAPHLTATALINTRQNGIVAGMELARTAFRLVDPSITFEAHVEDGDPVKPGDVLATVKGPARSVLSGERVALNYLMHLSGIATLTARYAAEVAHTRARIACTRKTLPGLRGVAKYAVRLGGGSNHRYGLDDAVLIKDNHIVVAGGVASAVLAARAYCGHLVKIEVEVDSLEQLHEALTASPDAVLLDNMGPDLLRQAVEINREHSGLSAEDYAKSPSRVKLEASGNVDLTTVKAIAESGVDYISTSKVTMAAPTLDIGLDAVTQ